MKSLRFTLVAVGLLSACGSPGPLEAFGSPSATRTGAAARAEQPDRHERSEERV